MTTGVVLCNKVASSTVVRRALVHALHSYKTYSGGVGLYKELPEGITVNLNGELRFSDFDGIHPFAGKVRQDERYTGMIALTKRDFNIWGYAPALQYSYVYNNSNISLYEFDSHAVDFKLSKDF